MAPPAADVQHPAFSNLFVQTGIRVRFRPWCAPDGRATNTRSRRGCAHLLAVHGADITAISYETDRSRFIGRDRTLAEPAAMDARSPVRYRRGPCLTPSCPSGPA